MPTPISTSQMSSVFLKFLVKKCQPFAKDSHTPVPSMAAKRMMYSRTMPTSTNSKRKGMRRRKTNAIEATTPPTAAVFPLPIFTALYTANPKPVTNPRQISRMGIPITKSMSQMRKARRFQPILQPCLKPILVPSASCSFTMRITAVSAG